MTDLTATFAFGGALLATVGVGEALRAWGGWKPEASRRVVHAATGLFVAASPLLFDGPAGIYALAVVFVVVNAWAVPRRAFPGMHAIRRRSWGTVTFPLVLLVALWTCWTLDSGRVYILQTAFLVLALADPIASVVGERVRQPRRYRLGSGEKSLAGSAAFFGVAWVLAVTGLVGIGGVALGPALGPAFVVAVLATGAEALAGRGWDNFFVVLAVIVPLVTIGEGTVAVEHWLAAVATGVAFAGLAFRARALDASGALAASGLAVAVVVAGPRWAVPGLVFFVLSSLLSRIGRRRRAEAEALAEKGSRRDAGQVYANGGVAWALLVGYLIVPHEALFWAYVGAFAAAAADTWATEVGTLVGGPTRLLWSGRRVPPGTSGGVSVAGTLGAAAGAVFVVGSTLPFAWPSGSAVFFLCVAASGVAAAFVDSFVGATVQAVYRDERGRLTERTGAGSFALIRGRRWITNDRVNLAGTLAGAGLAALWATFI